MTEKEEIQELKERLLSYEQNGSAKLFYALNRKQNEMADILNSVSLKNLDIAAKSDASFERVFKLLEKSETVSNSAKALGDIAGITGDEEKDIKRRMTSPESVAQEIGDYKSKDV